MLKIIRNFFYLLLSLCLFGIVLAWAYALKLEKQYQLDHIDASGVLWSMPARVYARPLKLYVGAALTPEQLVRELRLLDYEETAEPIKPKQYHRQGDTVVYYAPQFHFWDALRGPRRMQVRFTNGKVSAIADLSSLDKVAFERLNPLRIASIYPQQREDRILVKLKEVPKVLIDGLIANEDRNFWKHPGIDPKGLIRSIYITYIKREHLQGASTLTQQFIKNHYLNDERKFSRKIKEMLMALMLERHAGKEEILEGYLNEIYLGQDGRRAIHGFGLASEYYFNKNLEELGLHQIALLLALVREPGTADPRAHPEYAVKRRNLILHFMHEQSLISEEDEQLAASLPLDVVAKQRTSDRIRFPAFVDLVYKQLYQHYSKEDLTKQSLNIFTTLDPLVQLNVQKAVSEQLPKLESNKNLPRNFLQGAAVVVDVQSAQVKAVVGSRVPNRQGFNRALAAKRQIGSLIKPAVYLSALEYPNLYTLATLLDDSPLVYSRRGETWSPQNYDRRNHGLVLLVDALVHSYNIPTVRVALTLGLEDIVATLKRVGSRDGIKPYPSLALGAVQMTPLEVAQIYETYADGGFFQPLSSIREITTAEGEVVQRFDMASIRAIEATPYYLLLNAMQQIVSRGTARRTYQHFDRKYRFAGKTGTTDDYRDSWFAGFSGNYLTVTWVGNDRNLPTRLSGSTGGLPLWIEIMKTLSLEPLVLRKPDGIVTAGIDKNSGLLAAERCPREEVVELPFIVGSRPRGMSDCYLPDVEDDDSFYAIPADFPPALPPAPPPSATQSAPEGMGDPSDWFNN